MINSQNAQTKRSISTEQAPYRAEEPVSQATYEDVSRRSAAFKLSSGVCGLLIVAASWYMLRFVFGFAFDDSYIIFRYVENFAAGLGLAYSPGDRVEGFSCPLWIVLLGSLTGLTGLDPVKVSRWTGFAFWIATLLTVYGIALRSLLKRPDVSATSAPMVAALVALPALASISFLNWAVSGMETPLYALLLVIHTAYLAERRPVGAAVALCALMLTRPEAAIFGMLGFSLFVPRASIERIVKDNRALIIYGLITAGFLGTLTLFRLWYFHDYVPNTVRLKTPGSLTDTFNNGRNYLKGFADVNMGMAALYFAPLLAFPLWFRNRLANIAFLTVAMQLVFICFVGGDWMAYWRFVAPFVPLAALFAFEAALSSRNRLADGRGRRPLLRLAGAALVLAGLAWTVADGRKAFAAVTPENYKLTGIHYELGMWLKKNSPPNGLLAIGDAGEIPFHSKLPILDLHGLMDSHLSRLEKNFAMNPHSKTDPDYVFGRKPMWIVSIGNPFTPEQLAGEIRSKDVSNIYGLYDQLMDHPDFDAYYRHGKQFCLSPLYCYELFYDSRQISVPK